MSAVLGKRKRTVDAAAALGKYRDRQFKVVDSLMRNRTFIEIITHVSYIALFVDFFSVLFSKGSKDDLEQRLLKSTTLYVGNLSFYTREEQIYDLFARCGDVKRIVMGLDRMNKTPCGFCFMELVLF